MKFTMLSKINRENFGSFYYRQLDSPHDRGALIQLEHLRAAFFKHI